MSRAQVRGITSAVIATEPRIRVGWRFSLLAFAVVIAVSYGDLLPFQFVSPGAPSSDWSSMFGRVGWGSPSAEDVLVNFLAFVPVGLLMSLHFAGGSRRWGAAVLAGALFAAGLGVCLELLQTFIPVRVASRADMFNNGLGGLFGALLAPSFHGAWSRFRGRLGLYLVVFPHHVLWMALCGAVCLAALVPFDFSLSSAGLGRGLRAAQWWPVFGGTGATASLGMIRQSGLFAALAFAGAFSLRERGEGRLGGAMIALRRAVALVVILECLQVLTASHLFELGDIVSGCLGAVAGVCLAALIKPGDESAIVKAGTWPNRLWVVVWLLVLAGYQAAVMCVPTGSGEVPTVWLPMAAEFYLPATAAVGVIAEDSMAYAVLAWLMLVVLGGSGSRGRRCGVVVGVVAWSCVVEAGGHLIGGRTAGTTGPALAALASILVVVGMVWADQLGAAARRELVLASVSSGRERAA